MSDLQTSIGIIAVVIGFIGYAPYFRDIFRGKTKPHAFSWLVWGVLTSIAFIAQLVEGAGAGSWVTGAAAVVCITIVLLALQNGFKNFPLFDWISLTVAFIALIPWWWMRDPTLTVILVTFIHAVGFLPTIRKGIAHPFEETASTYALCGLKFAVALFALQKWGLATGLYPVSLVVMNSLFVLLLLIRRSQIKSIGVPLQ